MNFKEKLINASKKSPYDAVVGTKNVLVGAKNGTVNAFKYYKEIFSTARKLKKVSEGVSLEELEEYLENIDVSKILEAQFEEIEK